MEKYLIVLGFIFFDIVTGLIKAINSGDFCSFQMRKGGLRKLTEIITVVGAALLEYALTFIDLGIEIPVLTPVITYICVMELVSIIENICCVNPQLATFFKPYMEKLKKQEEDNDK